MRQSALGGGRIGEVEDDVGSIFTKLKVVARALLGVEPGLGGLDTCTEDVCWHSDRVGPNLVNCVEALLFLLSDLTSPFAAVLAELAIGKDRPRSFPLLATPSPQVKAVLYPEQSFP